MCTDCRHCSRKAYYSIQYVYMAGRGEMKKQREICYCLLPPTEPVVNCVCVICGNLLHLYTYVHTVWNGVWHDTMNELSIVRM